MTILLLATESWVLLRRLCPIPKHKHTHSDFLSNSGFEGNGSNVKLLNRTNIIALISTRANR